MNITKLRSQTSLARASKEAVEDAKFNDSKFCRHINKLIREAAKNGEYEISLNYYDTKEVVLGRMWGDPSIDSVIRHYSRKGFSAQQKHWLSPNGDANTSLIISWK